MMVKVAEQADERAMAVEDVAALLAALATAGCRVWVAGGWGVDALVGRQTRPHRDLDLAVDAADEAATLAVLSQRGYTIDTDWRPVRVELGAAGRGWVDLHPVVFDASGHGRQADLDGGHFDYPSDAFTTGRLSGREIPCLSRGQQIAFHTGYPLRPVDTDDLRLLAALPGQRS